MSVRPIVIKFGGATLGREDRIRKTVQVVRSTTGPVVVVVSAREGVTDRLKRALEKGVSKDSISNLSEDLRTLHPGIPDVLEANIAALEGDLARLPRARHAGSEIADAVLARGERLSAHWYAERLEQEGIRAEPLEADQIGLLTDGTFGGAVIQQSTSRRLVRARVLPVIRRGAVPVVTGYIGRDGVGRTTTLGRGGSDYTATSLGSFLDAERTILVKTDVSLFSADPRVVRRAEPIGRLSYEEAEELAQFGARVLHPLTVEPARLHGMEVTVESLERPGLSTTIGPAVRGRGIRAMTLLAPVALLHLRVPGGRQRKGVIAEVSRILSDVRINVVTLFTSSALLSILVEAPMGEAARRVLLPFVRKDGLGATLNGPRRTALVTVIGEGVAADIERLPRSVTSEALGISGTTRTLSLAVPEKLGPSTLREAHRALVEDRSARRTA